MGLREDRRYQRMLPTAIARTRAMERYHTPRSDMDQRKGVVVVKASHAAGLGDRLQAVLVAAAYCQITGRRLIVDWRDGLYAALGQDSFSLLFTGREVFEPLSRAAAIQSESVYPPVWRGRLADSLSDVVRQEQNDGNWDREEAHARYSFDFGRTDYDCEVLVSWDFEQAPKLLPHVAASLAVAGVPTSVDGLLHSIWNRFLSPAPSIAEAVDRFSQAHFARRPVVGVHSRYTREGMDRSPQPHAVLRVLTRLTAALGAATLFVSSDNEAAVLLYRRHLPQVITTPKWYPPPGMAMHLDCPTAQRVESGMAAAVDMLLLSRCDYLIYPLRSSFSRVAAVIGGVGAERRIPLVTDSDRL